MEPTIHGLQEIQALISSPVQWQVLLQLSERPVTTRDQWLFAMGLTPTVAAPTHLAASR
ncbi:hypothetical protein LVIS_2185 [Levilactobacillus brevis ATCC 367]|uniref:Uncharacterized protein n=1 Tax=Levilactobacillus brevis (strain ATCC 367 / BCRC 12310 / CIP 105137 / JCM 1170 / LMG 11437 / NCIMB 947 / NCTC 947) TaxID=387344 RepID=Q03NI7_LEVBA|nr:hypothetical protein [Levilactobacillus brevis]ABJ65235.1 hypothetical protein LVIS_2185 [Levilactobacillus brevis ATCC 367]